MSSKGNRTNGVVNGPEHYETMETSYSELINDINSVNQNGKIEVNDTGVAVELFLGGDYKFLLMAMGMSGATLDHAYAYGAKCISFSDGTCPKICHITTKSSTEHSKKLKN
ncbi:Hypothetical predicted protein [Paramuricea clavata]|uniref:Uncharacterized protein n=1 Tax=Paramuricea clavata TaxID=317549 RepID=A0A6S7L698_PARCT|nr:Hypothetical predicted protein [Paramuricea clavata]